MLNGVTQALPKGIGVLLGIAEAIPLRTDPILFWDVGARWGLSRQMGILRSLGLVLPTFFEPDKEEANRLGRQYPDATVATYALWNEDGNAQLHITSIDPGQSSLLRPIALDVAPSSPIVPTIRAENLIRSGIAAPEIIKLDIQGAELAALTGFGDTLDSVTCIETEVTFQPVYENQPTIDQITGFLMRRGFGLFDVQVFGVKSSRATISANAFYIRKDIKTDRQSRIEGVFRSINRIPMRP
jgi:FkbM family methyltransferase